MKRSPCEQTHPYDFNSCIDNKIATMIGCKPFWLPKKDGLKNCTDVRQLNAFLDKVRETQGMDDDTLFNHYQCLKPCSYMEYKV